MSAQLDAATLGHAHRSSGEEHAPAVTADEAQAIADVLDLGTVDHIDVHWISGRMGVQALLHPVHRSREDWLH